MLQKKLLIAAALAGFSMIGFSSAANAALPGYYVGGQLGWGDSHFTDDSDVSSGLKFNDTGLAGRIFGGYQFNQNFATELGYSRFSSITVDHYSGSISEYAVDLVGKGILTLNNVTNVYGKLGPAWIKTSGSISGSGGSYSGSDDKIYPTFGVGVSYDLTPNVPVDLSWNRIQRVGGSDNIPSTDLFSLGIAYNFG